MLREVAARLKDGHVTGVDRSGKMTALARNSGPTDRATVLTGDFPRLPDGNARYDLIFAINVAFFGKQDAAGREAVAALAELLKAKGAAYLFFESPAQQHVESFAAGALANLRGVGLLAQRRDRDRPAGVLVTAVRPGRSQRG